MADELLVSLVRFEDPAGVPPLDEKGGLDALVKAPGCTYPTRERGICGYSAVFSPTLLSALVAQDLTVGATSQQRDVSVQAIIRWDFTAQNTAGTPGTIVARGYGDAAAEYMPFAMELFVVDYATQQGAVRFLWNTAAGTLRTELGAGFYVPTSGYFMVTATRHWTSLTSATIRYYVNEYLVAATTTTDGDIASSTTGHVTIGARRVAGAYTNYFAGAIDELAISNYELTLEEIRSTWRRISIHQTDGVRIIQDLMPIGLPISSDPTSKAQIDLQTMGTAIGFADSLTENVRENTMPDKAYGAVLRQWEAITRDPALPGDSVDARRARITSHLRRRSGVSIPGVEAAIDGLLGVTAGQLTYYAFNPTIQDTFAAAPDPQLWFMPNGGVDVIGGEMRLQLGAGSTRPWDSQGTGLGQALCSVIPINARTTAQGARVSNVSILACLDDRTPGTATGTERGVCLASWSKGSMFFVGFSNAAGTTQLCYQKFKFGVAVNASPVPIAGWGGNLLTSIRIILDPRIFGSIGQNESVASIDFFEGGVPTSESQWTRATTVNFGVAGEMDYAGFYIRTLGASTAGAACDLRITNATKIRDNTSERPYYWYAYRNPALGGSPDLAGANRVIDRMRHAYTKGAVTSSLSLICDDPNSPMDYTPLGAI